jgi:transposase-like protein
MSRTEVRQKWRAILAGYEQSDSSISEYCRRHHINPASFYQWRKKLAADQPGRFLPVVIEQPSNPVRVCFSNGAILEVQEHSSLAALQLAVAVLS